MRLGVAGYGRRIQGLIDHHFRKGDPSLRVVGVVDPDEARARERLPEADRGEAVFYRTLDEMVRRGRLDALAIGSGCDTHAPLAARAARYDLPLFLEKPVAVSMRQALALERAFKDSRCPVVVSFPLRVSALCELARRYIEEGAVGEPVHVHAVNYVPYGRVYWEDRYRDYLATQGLFLQKATHDFDYLAWLMGAPIVRVSASWTRHKVFGGRKRRGLVCSKCNETATCLESPWNRRRAGLTGEPDDHPCLFSKDCGDLESGTNEDCSSALLEFAGGAHGVYSQVFFIRHDAAARGAKISGYHGTIDFDWYAGNLRRIRHHQPMSAEERLTSTGLSHFGGDAALAMDFIDLVAGRRKNSRTPIEAGIQSVYACLAARESAQKGRPIRVRQVGA